LGEQDRPVWISSPSGKFNCTSATWEQLRHKENEVPWWKLIIWFPG